MSMKSLFRFAFGALIANGQAGAAAPFFDGAQDAKSRAVMRQAELDIDRYRKGSFTLELVDARGNPVQAEVKAELRQHAFKFGTNLFGLSAMPDSELKRTAFAAAKEIFNTVVVCDYWRSPDRKEQERKRDQPLEDLRWAEANGLTPRFHAVLYNDPRWTMGRNLSAEDYWQTIEARFRYVAQYRDRVGEYDVINEFISGHYWPEFMEFYKQAPNYPQFRDPAVGKQVLAMARRYLPDAKLVVLEAQVPSIKNERFREIVAYWKALVASGADFDCVGTQAHFYNKGRPFQAGHPEYGADTFLMAGINEAFELLGSVGKSVLITEFNGPSRNKTQSAQEQAKVWTMSEAENAAWQVNFYRLAFSKPYIKELTRWFHLDEIGGRGMDAGILTKTGEPHAIYHELKKLLREEWSTRASGKTTDGAFRFRGYYGRYEIAVPGYPPVSVELTQEGRKKVELK